MMPMSFELGHNVHNFLFKNLNINSKTDLFGAAVCMALFAIGIELLKASRVYFIESLKSKECDKSEILMPNNESAPNYLSIDSQPKRFPRKKNQLIILHILQTFLTIVQLLFGYILMLAVMYYNTWIFISVILGSGFGYYLSGIFITHPFMSKEVAMDKEAECCSLKGVAKTTTDVPKY